MTPEFFPVTATRFFSANKSIQRRFFRHEKLSVTGNIILFKLLTSISAITVRGFMLLCEIIYNADRGCQMKLKNNYKRN